MRRRLSLAILAFLPILFYQNCSAPFSASKPASAKVYERGNGNGYDLKFSGLFPKTSIWSKDIREEPLDKESSLTISWMSQNGNWGAGELAWAPKGNLYFAPIYNVLYADETTPHVPFHKNLIYVEPDCDSLTSFPLPAGGSITPTQGKKGYFNCASEYPNENCHLIVVDTISNFMYVSFQTDVANNEVTSKCGIKWDLSKVYPPEGRGEQCTSADSTGLPTGALLFSADDLAAGHIDHALRFTLPNSRIRRWEYVHPANHGTGNMYGKPEDVGGASAPAPAPMRGARFRLKADFPVNLYSPGVQVILRALQKYGMIVSDGGDLSLTAASDEYTKHKYSEFGLTSGDQFEFLNVENFDIVDGGERIPITYDCVRNGE